MQLRIDRVFGIYLLQDWKQSEIVELILNTSLLAIQQHSTLYLQSQ